MVTTHMSMSLCPVLGFGLLLGLVIWLVIRGRRAAGVALGILAVCMLIGFAMFSVRVSASPGESVTASGTPWRDAGPRLRPLVLFLATPILVGLIGVIAQGLARNPQKNLAAIAGVFLCLLLAGILAVGVAIMLPAFSRARQVAARNRMSAAPLVTALPQPDAPTARAAPAHVEVFDDIMTPDVPPASQTTPWPYTVATLLLMSILAYAFLAAGRYSFFKWPVRVVVAGAFVALCVMAMHFSERLSAAAGHRRATETALSRAVSFFRPSPSPAERLVGLTQTSADGVATAVATAESTDIDDAQRKPLDLLVCGEYRIVGGDAEGARKA
ncbi:MAG: hypothetical protein ACPMAQ_12215, partial [Phycisphaerae bacterium]